MDEEKRKRKKEEEDDEKRSGRRMEKMGTEEKGMQKVKEINA